MTIPNRDYDWMLPEKPRKISGLSNSILYENAKKKNGFNEFAVSLINSLEFINELHWRMFSMNCPGKLKNKRIFWNQFISRFSIHNSIFEIQIGSDLKVANFIYFLYTYEYWTHNFHWMDDGRVFGWSQTI